MKKILSTDLENKELDVLPIRRGCSGMCGCLGTCLQIVGHIPRKEYEDFLMKYKSIGDFLSEYTEDK